MSEQRVGRLSLRVPEAARAVVVPAVERGLTNDDLLRLAEGLAEVRDLPPAACAAVVLTSEGGDFCPGRSLPPEAEAAGADGPVGLEARNAAPVLGLFTALHAVRAPVVGVVSGRANGLGCALAAACDVTLATPDATFSLPELRHGIPATLALSVLRRVVPPKRLLEMVLGSIVLGADDALAAGVVTRVVPRDQVDDALSETLAPLVAAPLAARTAKRYLRASRGIEDDGAAAELGSALLAGALSSRDVDKEAGAR